MITHDQFQNILIMVFGASSIVLAIMLSHYVSLWKEALYNNRNRLQEKPKIIEIPTETIKIRKVYDYKPDKEKFSEQFYLKQCTDLFLKELVENQFINVKQSISEDNITRRIELNLMIIKPKE